MKIGAVEAILRSVKRVSCLLYLSASSIGGVHVVLFGIDGFRNNCLRESRAVFMGIREIVFTRVPWNRTLLFWEKTPRCNSNNSDKLNLSRLMSYICGAPILDVSRSHTTTQHSR